MRIPADTSRSAAVGLVAICLLALFLRLKGLDWDGYEHFHPDERYISWVATSIEFSGHDSPADLFDPRRSRFNPFYWPAGRTTTGIVVPFDEPRRFAYGHFPLYLTVGVAHLIENLPLEWVGVGSQSGPVADILNLSRRVEYDHVTIVGRALAALFDTGSVLLIFFLGRELFSRRIGLTAALFLALNVMHIQLAHYFVFDTYATFFVLLTLLALIFGVNRREQPSGRWWLVLAGAAAGLAVGSKFSAILVLLPLTAGAFLFGRARFLRRWAGLTGIAFLFFALTNPFALLDTSCQIGDFELAGRTFRLASCYLENILRESVMVRGGEAFPFTRQYEGTTPYLYPLEMQLRWGMGWLLGLAAFGGFLAFILDNAGRLWRGKRIDSLPAGSWLLLAWTLPFFISTGSFVVKFMRYLQPLTPFLMLFAAWWLWRLRPHRLRRPLLALVILATALYALAFSQMYAAAHPWVTLSEWVYAHVPDGEKIAIELWDETLPATIERDGVTLSRSRYDIAEINWLSRPYEGDDPAKLAQNLAVLASADYLIVASNRSYGVMPRLPEVYPLSSRFYPLLFAGELGFRPIFIVDRTPQLGKWHLAADSFGWPGLRPPGEIAAYFAGRSQISGGRADESFTVYDQPLAVIWINERRLTETEMAEILAGN